MVDVSSSNKTLQVINFPFGVPPPPRRGDTGGVAFADVVDVIESRGPVIPASPRGPDILDPVLLTIVDARVE